MKLVLFVNNLNIFMVKVLFEFKKYIYTLISILSLILEGVIP